MRRFVVWKKKNGKKKRGEKKKAINVYMPCVRWVTSNKSMEQKISLQKESSELYQHRSPKPRYVNNSLKPTTLQYRNGQQQQQLHFMRQAGSDGQLGWHQRCLCFLCLPGTLLLHQSQHHRHRWRRWRPWSPPYAW